MPDDNGGQRTIPCDKDKIGTIVFHMMEKRREYYLGSGDLLRFRVWSAFSFSCMQGLSQCDMAPSPATVTDFLEANRFDSPTDEEGARATTGFTPLMFAAASGNVSVVRELLKIHKADVNARVRTDDMNPDFGLEKGCDPLGIATAACPQHQAHDVIGLLLESGANPNSRTVLTGGTPLMAGVVNQSLAGVRSLLTCAGRKLDLEIGLKINNATALNLAGVMSTKAIIEALLLAGANLAHR